ncbi:MAG TPA: PBSX family phage terminase large subunit [Patescibacteria group bacterium]|nr:PBSX family phage terminase large subunit [Patescibacteria group bacterium]
MYARARQMRRRPRLYRNRKTRRHATDTSPQVELTQLEATRSYLTLIENTRPIVILEGSTRSGKTWAILMYLIASLSEERLVCFCGRNDGRTCERSVVRDFKTIMGLMECWDSTCWNGTLKKYEWKHGSILEFGGTSDVTKLHGPQIDILWLNEVMEQSYDAWKQLTQRTSKLRILDFNPSLTQHWVFERVMTRTGEFSYCHTTYRDNPFLSPEQIAEIESFEPTARNIARGTADEWHWTVYGLGKRGRREGVIYKLWDKVETWPDRMNCQRYGYGLDFGYSEDPTAVVECALFQHDLWLREVVYETGLLVTRNVSKPSEPSLEARLEAAGVDKKLRIHAESAEPESCRDLTLAGYNVVPTVKSPDSIRHGIDLLRRRRIHVWMGSQNVQIEIENYTWDRNRATGVWLPDPIDKFNHAMDAARYWALAELRPQRDRPAGPAQAQTVLTQRAGVRILAPRSISVLRGR